MATALEQTNDRFLCIFGSARGSGRTHSDSILPRPGREGILDVLYNELRYVATWPRGWSFSRKYVIICRDHRRGNHLYIADMARARNEALEALDTVFDGIGEIDSYVIDLDEDERVCVHRVEIVQTRRGPMRDFRSAGFPLTVLLARA